MMMSPNAYVEFEVRGMSKEKVLSRIHGLQRNMASMKNQAESEFEINPSDRVRCPSLQVRIDVTREYIAETEKYYQEIGGKYEPNALERKAAKFDANMEHIKAISIRYGGFCGKTEERKLTRDGNGIAVERSCFPYGSEEDFNAKFYEGLTWQDIIEELTNIHMGEWKSSYVAYNVLDGTQWSVELEYDNGVRAKRFYGSNKYPYNFEKFLDVMEMAKRFERGEQWDS